MLFIAIILGQTIGTIVNWAGDYLIRFSESGNATKAEMNVHTKPVLWSALVSPSFRRSLYHREKDAWLRVFVETLLVLLYTFLWQWLGFTFPFFFLATICTFLVLVALIDLKYQLVLNILIFPAMGAIILFQAVPLGQTTWLSLLGGLGAFLVFFLAALVAPGRLGGGDIKLATFLGLVFGFPYVFWALVAGALMGGVTAVFLSLTNNWEPKRHFPYAPSLCLGAMVALFYDPTPWLLAL